MSGVSDSGAGPARGPRLLELVAEAERQFTICNACRYCEGYCAVFPAMERRASFTTGDAVYLANLCHDCRACFQACMFAPPHEFAVDVPALMSEVRTETYRRYAWPQLMAGWFRRSGLAAGGMIAVGLVLVFAVIAAAGGLPALTRAGGAPGAFYRVVPHLAMLIPGLVAGALVLLILWGGLYRFWVEARGTRSGLFRLDTWLRAAWDVAELRYLGGGGGGCYYPDPDRPTMLRRLLHSLVFWGFAAAFVATVLAAIWQELLGRLPPYPLLSPPVLFGAAGGLAMVIGTSGLLWLKRTGGRRLTAREMLSLDLAFLALLDLAALTGMLLLALRGTSWMGVLLAVHLAVLVSLYATFPYGKFVHAVYRFAALAVNRAEAS